MNKPLITIDKSTNERQKNLSQPSLLKKKNSEFIEVTYSTVGEGYLQGHGRPKALLHQKFHLSMAGDLQTLLLWSSL